MSTETKREQPPEINNSSIATLRPSFFPAVTRARAQDIQSCLNLELALNERRPEAQRDGFLLTSSDTIDSYGAYLKLGSFWVVHDKDKLVGFLFALPPGCERMEKLRAARDKFILEPQYSSVFDLSPLSWLAKVGVDPAYMHKGIATALYEKLFTEHSDWNFLTTTVLRPVTNVPSANLQRRFGFKEIGTLPMGDRGVFKDVVCQVHLRAKS